VVWLEVRDEDNILRAVERAYRPHKRQKRKKEKEVECGKINENSLDIPT
jgi:hypothetical protein